MNPRATRDLLDRFAARLGTYAKDTGKPAGKPDEAEDGEGDFVIPEDLSSLTDDQLHALHEQAVHHFDELFNDGQVQSDEDLKALEKLTEGIETLLSEISTRDAAVAERADAAAALAARAHPEQSTENPDDGEDGPDGGTDEAGNPAEAETEEKPVLVAGSPKEIRVNLGSLRSRQHMPARGAVTAPKTMKDIVFASGDGINGYSAGQGLDWSDVGKVVDRRIAGFNQAQFAAAARQGQSLRQQFGVATIHKPFAEGLVIQNNDPQHVEEVLRRAGNEKRLKGNSLVAAGGWGAPSETIYDLCELESRDGLLSIPEVGVTRGGFSWTQGPSFSDIYNATGFSFTEAQDIAGEYAPGAEPTDPNVVGDKPCYKVEFPDFTEARLAAAGLCIQAGLLAQRGYPEVIARTVRGGLVAHDHKMSARVIAALVAGSTAITMTAGQAGALAPLLTAIELQAEHIRYTERMARGTTMEAIFPYWVRGAIRSDLSRRAGIDPNTGVSVTDAQINAWFSSRGISPQFVYDWQDINGTAATAFTAWPATVKFLMYPAGTWVRGNSDIITLDTIYDSVLLAQNDYLALFTEEGWLVAKLCRDSRVITVALDPSGTTGAGVPLAATGVPAA